MLDYLQLIIPAVALLLAVVIQLLAARAFPQLGIVPSFACGFVAGLSGLLFLSGLIHLHQHTTPWIETAALLLVNVGIYSALASCFLAFLNLGVTSIRIRVFSELEQSKEGLSIEQLRSKYNCRTLVELRLERLLRNKQVIVRDGRYFLVGHVYWCIAMLTRSARWVVMGIDEEDGVRLGWTQQTVRAGGSGTCPSETRK